MRSVEISARTRQEAIQAALKELGAELHEVEIEIVDEGSRGIFGLGARPVRVRVTAEHLPPRQESASRSARRPERREAQGAPRQRRPAAPEPRERPAAAQPRAESGPKRDAVNRGRPERARQDTGKRQAAAGSHAPQRDARAERAAPDSSAAHVARSGRGEPRNSDAPRGNRAARAREERNAAPSQAPQRAPQHNESPAVSAATAPPEMDEARAHEAAALLEAAIGHMGITAKVTSQAGESGEGLRLLIESEDSALLIGRKGRTLAALQYLINRMIHRDEGESERIVVDVEGYLDRRRAALEEMALRMAEKVKRSGRRVNLKPLAPSERRIVHLTLQEDAAVRTFSVGSDALRSVVIAPADEPEAGDASTPRKRSSRSRGGSRRRRSRRDPGKQTAAVGSEAAAQEVHTAPEAPDEPAGD